MKTIQVRWNKHAGHCWRSKDELISNVFLWTPSHGWAKVGRPARTYQQQLCANTGCNLEDLSGAMDNRDRWQKRVREIRASSVTLWWWWWWWLVPYWFIIKMFALMSYTFFKPRVCILPTSPPWTGCVTKSIFKQGKAGLNSEFYSRRKYIYKERLHNHSISIFFKTIWLAQAMMFKYVELLGDTTNWKMIKSKIFKIFLRKKWKKGKEKEERKEKKERNKEEEEKKKKIRFNIDFLL